MYDTVLLCLTKADVSGVNFLEVVPRLLVGVVACWWVLSLAGGCCRLLVVRCLNVAGGLDAVLFLC